MLEFISDSDHYFQVLELATKTKKSSWIGTVGIKDLYVVQGKGRKTFPWSAYRVNR